MLHPLSISPFLFCFPRPFLSLWFHPCCRTLPVPPCFPSFLLQPSPLCLCNQSCDWAVFTGSSQGPANVAHLLYNYSPHLTLQSLSLLWSDYRQRDRKHSPYKLFTPTLSIPAPPPSTSPTPCCTLQALADRQEAVLSFCSNGASSLQASWLHSRAWLDHQTGTWSFNTD